MILNRRTPYEAVPCPIAFPAEPKSIKKRKNPGKGADHERIICRRLSMWVQGTEKPELFWRSASSGAQATMGRRRGHKSKMGGDIVSIDAAGNFLTELFSLECKFYASFNFEEWLKDTKGEAKQWWIQCCGDAEHANKLPMMIFKKNGSPAYLMLCNKGRGIFEDLYGALPGPYFILSSKEIILLFENFIAVCDSEALKEYQRGRK